MGDYIPYVPAPVLLASALAAWLARWLASLLSLSKLRAINGPRTSADADLPWERRRRQRDIPNPVRPPFVFVGDLWPPLLLFPFLAILFAFALFECCMFTLFAPEVTVRWERHIRRTNQTHFFSHMTSSLCVGMNGSMITCEW